METKICTQCGRELPIDQFHWRSKAKGTRRSECKECHNNFMRQRYKDKKDKVSDLKASLGCVKCGDKRPYVLDFHHKDPSIKEDTVARMLSNAYALERVMEEIEKCVCLCANCHREFHYLEKEKGITLEEYLS